MLLSIDSSAGASVALLGPEGVIASRRTSATNTHAEWLAPAVQEVLSQAVLSKAVLNHAGVTVKELTGVVVGVGPGPFTGLRVGLALAHSLAEAWGLPLHGVCSLDALAYRLVRTAGDDTPKEFLVATDARRHEIYWARYRSAQEAAVMLDGPHVSAADQAPALPVVGAGAGLYPEQLHPVALDADVATWFPDAADLAMVAADAEEGTLRDPYPLYLRESDAQVPQQMRGR